MRITTKGRYGTRMVLDIALYGQGGPVPIADIARRQGISEKYLEKLINELKKAGLIKSRRGVGGGHTLAKPTSQITVGDIVRALEKEETQEPCSECGVCNRAGQCMTRGIWIEASQAMLDRLDAISIEELVRDCPLP